MLQRQLYSVFGEKLSRSHRREITELQTGRVAIKAIVTWLL
ncbi:hypothetical protein AGRO_2070 [Agrobacterium sp. ATCC 31749]|nr:hypothetical protein AGRO_2070 [Agrobacterium sp. ATCC 31749]